jgi:CCA-adding enzyme
MSQLSAVLEAVRGRVQPDADEREQLEAAASELERRAGEAIDELPVDADVLRAGSTARSTWLAGDRDIDLFVRFPPDLDSQTLERHGLTVGHEILPDGREEYAEHPYVTGEYAGFDVDLVGCFDVAAATEIRSSVDRTPFHTAYLHDRLDDEIANEVRLAKQFLTGIGAYGSDLKTRGYSGYLTELLTLEYGGFVSLLEAAADWTPPIKLDPEGHGTTSFNDPLVVIDPTDPERNVAAVCALTTSLGSNTTPARSWIHLPQSDSSRQIVHRWTLRQSRHICGAGGRLQSPCGLTRLTWFPTNCGHSCGSRCLGSVTVLRRTGSKWSGRGQWWVSRRSCFLS